jgi:type I restriction-modification system DNA methylase subunit
MEEVTIKNSGATFTPPLLADFLADKLISHLEMSESQRISILDPACGEGELLLSIANKVKTLGINQFQIRGYDTNTEYLDVAKSNLSDIKGITVNFLKQDFLESEGAIVEKSDLFHQTKGSELADIIIANPPYVRTQILGTKKAQELAKRFNLTGRVDLYYPFLIAMTNVLIEGGLIGVITSNRYLFTKSGESIRKFLLDNYDILEVIDLGDTKLFEAAVLPAIFIGRKKTGRKKISNPSLFAKIYEEPERNGVRNVINSNTLFDILKSNKSGYYLVGNKRYHYSVGLLKHSLKRTDIWQMTNEEENKWIEIIKSNTFSLIGDLFKVRVGVKSCADNVFIKEDWQNEYIKPEEKLFKKLISQENIKRWRGALENDLHILYPYYSKDGKRFVYDLKDFPIAKEYFEANRPQLESRTYVIESGRSWYEIWVPQNPALWALPKIVFPDISLDSRFYYDDQGSVVNGNCYWISAMNERENELLFLIQGVANSRLMSQYHDLCFNNKLYSGRRRYFSQYIEKYPIPDPNKSESIKIIEIVKQLNTLSSLNQEVTDLENELNNFVEKAFGF